jgi:hypothetical protein
MYSWIVGRAVRFLYGKVSKGDLRLPLLGLAMDARLFFPGQLVRRRAAGQARDRVLDAALRLAATGVHSARRAVAGPPWNMRVFMRFSDRIVAPNGYV